MIQIIPNWHPVFVHFPIAFATAAMFLFAASKLFQEQVLVEKLVNSGRWMLWAAAALGLVAAVFGWFAFNSVDHDEAGHAAMTLHRNWALLALAALTVLAVLDIRSRRVTAPGYGFLGLLVVAWLLVVSAAWHGGEVVFRHGLGVMSIPAPENHGHQHEHGHDEAAMPDGTHEEAVHGHDAIPLPATNTATAVPKKSGHSHAPGTPVHQD